jgi:DNA (cytosine-5)-methyltransferase 1
MNSPAMRSIELFAGAGGLALGIERAGFRHDTVVERDKDCCQTIRENQRNGFPLLEGWRIFSGDVRQFDYSEITGEVDLLAGGPPCQPFSIGGKHKGPLDRRDMFPEVARAVRELRPRAVMVENVRGLLRESFAKYFEYVTLQLRYPELMSKPDEDWSEHLSRLERHHTKGKVKGLHYNIVFRRLNAADYGVPQKRERVIIVGFRSDLKVEWSFPDDTHSQDALLIDQWVDGEYWERHRIAKRQRPAPPARMTRKIECLRAERSLSLFSQRPWRTVRDALSGLPDPEGPECAGWANHQYNPGARSYAGHTGSPIDEPAKTLKAGDHGVPGGENALVKEDGSVRYFTVRESARLQTFPDDYVLHGAWSEAMRQLGNAVPVLLGEAVAGKIRMQLQGIGH